MNSKVYLNGKLTPNPAVEFFLRNPLSAHAFETMLVERGIIFRLHEHLDRLWASAHTIGMVVEVKRELLESDLSSIAKEVVSGTCLRVLVTNADRIVWTFKRSIPESLYQSGVCLSTSVTRRQFHNSVFPEAKSNQFLNGILSLLDTTEDQAFETLMLDASGFVKEARVWNLFIVKRGILKTPSSDGILNGVTRNFVVECAQKEKILVAQSQLTRHDIWNAEEAFLTNTSSGIVPVKALDGRKIGAGIPGKLIKRLSKRYKIEFEKEIKS